MGGSRTNQDLAKSRRAASERLPTSARPKFANAGSGGSVLVGLFSLVLIWLGVGYVANEDAIRTENTAYQDTANLARAFEEHIIRLMQAHDQILLFARTSIVKDPRNFRLDQWTQDQQFANGVTL